MTGNPALDKIILGINGAVVAASVGLVYFSHNLLKPLPVDQAGEFGDSITRSINEMEKTPVSMDEIIVNLYSAESRLRFLNTKMELVIHEEAQRSRVMLMKYHIFDTLIDVAGNMTPNELNSVTGKILLEKRVKDRVNEMAPRPIIKKILFTKFIIQ